MKKKKNKKIIIFFLIIFIIFLICISIALVNKNKEETDISINNNFQSIEDIIVFYESKYIKQEKSEKDGYDLDIYAEFKYNLFEGNESKESFFKMVIESIVKFDNFENIRLIDESKDILIEVECDQNSKSIIAIYYNGDIDYFKKEISKRAYDNALEIDIIYPTVNSQILNEAINKEWISKEIDFGTQESTFNKYSIYFEEGYKVRTIQRKVYNIIFTDKYEEEIIDGIKVGEDFSEIKKKLGEGFSNSSNSLLSYKTNDFYIIFSSSEVSIYPNIKYDTDEFEELVSEYSEKKDFIDFMDKLTDLWPDYDYYEYDTNYIDIRYTLKGIRITYNIDDKNGIRIYENYQGELKDTKTDNEAIIYQLDQSLIVSQEESRQTEYEFSNSERKKETMQYSSKFYVQLSEQSSGGFYKGIKIISLDENYPDNEFDENLEIADYKWINDYTLIYSRYGKGIYKYNAQTRETESIVEGEQEFLIKEYNTDNKTLYYDDMEIVVE